MTLPIALLCAAAVLFVASLSLFLLGRGKLLSAQTLVNYALSDHGITFRDLDTWRISEENKKLHRLVLWLSLTFRVVSYDEDGTERVTWNTPKFPTVYPWGEPMPESIDMAALFHSVVGDSADGQYVYPKVRPPAD